MADIVLRDRNGNQVEYPGVESIKLNTVGGGTKEFIDPDTVPQAVEKTIDPDFSAGDMEVIPEDGQVFSKVGIPKPSNLLPENIAEGVDIAGIIGTFAGGSKARFTSGVETVFIGTIKHNLGVMPDLVIAFISALNHPLDRHEDYGIVYMSDALKYSVGFWYNAIKVGTQQANLNYASSAVTPSSCTTTEITFPFSPRVDKNYFWIAVGGLT